MNGTPASVATKLKAETPSSRGSSQNWISSPDDAWLYEAVSQVETTVHQNAEQSAADNSFATPRGFGEARDDMEQSSHVDGCESVKQQGIMVPFPLARRTLFNKEMQPESVSTKNKSDLMSEARPSVTESDQSESNAQFGLNFGFGFATAGGNLVSVSEKALQRARSLIGAVEDEDVAQSRADIASTSETGGQAPAKFGFATASGRTLTISDAALKRAEVQFAETASDSPALPSVVAPPRRQSGENDSAGDNQKQLQSDSGNLESDCSLGQQKSFSGDLPMQVQAQEQNAFACAFRSAKGDAPILVSRSALHNASKTLRDVNLNVNVDSKTNSKAELNTAAIKRGLHPDLKRKRDEHEASSGNAVKKCKTVHAQSPTRAEKLSIRELVGGVLPGSHAYSSTDLQQQFNLPLQAMRIDCESASDFQFKNESNTSEGWREAHTLLTTGARAARVSSSWTRHHYGMVVWKLVALAVSFPHQFAASFSFYNVVQQLKNRASVENSARRSALRMLFENDESAARRLVVTVASRVRVIRVGESRMNVSERLDESRMRNKKQSSSVEELKGLTRLEFEVTDGWYCMHAVMTGENAVRLCETGRLTTGVKLMTTLAQVHRCRGAEDASNSGNSSWSVAQCGEENNEPCAPLDDCARFTFLRLHLNSTRRARWDTKLGFQRNLRPFPVSLDSLFSDGGVAGCLTLQVCRVYPTLFLERALVDDRSVCLFRNERAEIPVRLKADDRARQTVDDLCRTVWSQELAACASQRGSNCPDTQFAEKVRSRVEKLLAETDPRTQSLKPPERRDVVPLLRVRVLAHPARECDALLTVWRPAESLVETLREGALVQAFALLVTPTHRASALCTSLQLSSNKSSSFLELRASSTLRLACARSTVSVRQLCESHSTPQFCEVDLQGVVLQRLFVHDNSLADNRVEVLLLRDELSHDCLAVECRNSRVAAYDKRPGFAEFGFSDILAVENAVCIRNLQFKHTNRRTYDAIGQTLPVAYFTELSCVSRYTPKCSVAQANSLYESHLSSSTQEDLDCHALLDRIETESALMNETENSAFLDHSDLNATVRESAVLRQSATKTSTPLLNAVNFSADAPRRFRVGISRRQSASFVSKTNPLDLVQKPFGRRFDATE